MNDFLSNNSELNGLIQKYVENNLDWSEAEFLLDRMRQDPSLVDSLYDQLLLDDRLYILFQPRLLDKSRLEQLISRTDASKPKNKKSPSNFPETSLDSDNAVFPEESFNLGKIVRLACESPSLLQPEREKTESSSSRAVAARPYDPRAKISYLPLQIAVPTLVLLFGLLFFFEWNAPHKVVDGNAGSVEPLAVAVITNIDDVQWPEDVQPPRLGEPLPPGTLRFESGLIELLFFNGVRSVVEGPAELILLNEKQVFCRKGNWSMTVPPQGGGFEIQTSHWTVRDIGTEFFVSIDNGNCDLHVLKGTVEMEKPACENGTPEKIVFTTDQAGGFRSGELLTRMTADFERFISQSEMRRRADAFLCNNRKGQIDRKKIARSAICVVDAKENAVRWGNFASAELYGGMPTEGLTPKTPGILFTRPEDRLRLKTSGETKSLTVLLWMRIDRLNDELNPILMSEGMPQGGIVWHLSPQGAFLIGIRNRAAHGAETLQTPNVYTADRLGRWTHLALSINDKSQWLTVYMDGDPIYSKRLSRTVPLNLNGLDIGNWKPQQSLFDNVRQLDGAFGKAMVFDRALEIEEIRTLYRQEKGAIP